MLEVKTRAAFFFIAFLCLTSTSSLARATQTRHRVAFDVTSLTIRAGHPSNSAVPRDVPVKCESARVVNRVSQYCGIGGCLFDGGIKFRNATKTEVYTTHLVTR